MTPEQQADLVGPEAVAGEARPVGGGFALLDPLLGRPALVVEADDGPVRPGEGGDDEAHPREKFPEMMLDLGDHPPRPVPGGGLILEAPVADQRGVAGSAAGPGEQILDRPAPGHRWPGGGSRTSRPAAPAPRRGPAGQRPRRRGRRRSVLRPGSRSMTGRSTSSHPSALWTLPGRSLAARQSPPWLKTKSG